jgi:hypothetical protein
MGAVERLRCIWRDETAGRMQVTISKKNQAEMNRPQVGNDCRTAREYGDAAAKMRKPHLNSGLLQAKRLGLG